MLLGNILAYASLKSRSVIAVAVAHGAVNASSLLAASITQGNDLLTGVWGFRNFGFTHNLHSHHSNFKSCIAGHCAESLMASPFSKQVWIDLLSTSPGI